MRRGRDPKSPEDQLKPETEFYFPEEFLTEEYFEIRFWRFCEENFDVLWLSFDSLEVITGQETWHVLVPMDRMKGGSAASLISDDT